MGEVSKKKPTKHSTKTRKRTVKVPSKRKSQVGDELPLPPDDPCDACKDADCKDVPNGEVHLKICDGKTSKTLRGTAEGQYPSWDNTAKKWVLANV